MNPAGLIPYVEPIPAHWLLFEVLDVALFMVHILFVNVVLGGTLIVIGTLFTKSGAPQLAEPASAKIPTVVALAVNAGIAPLLFIQVIYGHLFYTSSVFIALGWILIIPFIIIAYYATYLNKHNREARPLLAKVSAVTAGVFFLYIAFMFVNNMTMMIQPPVWEGYFENRSGWMLNLGDPTLVPRYLHFVVASVAVAGLFIALVWHWRGRKGGEEVGAKIKLGLTIFAWATVVQIVVGLWWIIALPREIMLEFMGGSIARTITFLLGFLLALSAVLMALRGRLMATLFHLLGIVAVMVIQRALLRASYLREWMDMGAFELRPQTSVLILFLAVLLAGAGSVWWMVRKALEASGTSGRTQS